MQPLLRCIDSTESLDDMGAAIGSAFYFRRGNVHVFLSPFRPGYDAVALSRNTYASGSLSDVITADEL